MKEVKDYNPSKDQRLIDCKTECGNERCYARRYGLFAEKTCPNFVEPNPVTNYDRLVSKSPEELAKWISTLADCCGNGHCGEHCPLHTLCWSKSNESTLDWLKQEAVHW